MSSPDVPFLRLSSYLRQRHGRRVYKVSLHCGFTCPNRDGTVAKGGCTFCSIPAIGPLDARPVRPVAQQLDEGMHYLRKRYRAEGFVAYYQDYSATYDEPERLRQLYQPALDHDDVVGLAVATRPDCLPPRVLRLLSQIRRQKALWIELGLQIADDEVLRSVNRGHTVADFAAGVERCQALGIDVCAHVIIGLPGSTPAIEQRTARLLAELGVWGVKIHAFHVIEHTPMARDYRAGRLPLLSRSEFCDRVVEFVELLPAATVIHRVTGEAPPRLTLAPEWTINKMAVLDAVVAAFALRDSHQGKRWQPRSANALVTSAGPREAKSPESPARSVADARR